MGDRLGWSQEHIPVPKPGIRDDFSRDSNRPFVAGLDLPVPGSLVVASDVDAHVRATTYHVILHTEIRPIGLTEVTEY